MRARIPHIILRSGALFWSMTALFFLGCATDDPIPINTAMDNGPSTPANPDPAAVDYMLFTRSPSSANGFVTGFDQFPEGDLDIPSMPQTLAFPAISGGVSFQNYVVNQQKLFGGAGYQRLTLNENKVPQDGAIIETLGGGSAVAFLNDNKGYYVDFNERNIQVFDPVTFIRKGEISLSEAFQIPENASNYYGSLYVVGEKLYACLYTGRSFPPFVYQSPVGSVVAVIDTDTDTYIKDIFAAGTKFPGQPFLRYDAPITDETGTLYLPTQGGLGLDLSTGENTPAKILKIPAGADDFDPEYGFMPQMLIPESNATIIVNAGFLYAGNGIAYTNILMEDPETPVDLVNKALMRWAKIDLVNRTAVLVAGVPANAGLTSGMAYNYNGKVQLVVYNPEEAISAVYETDIERNGATEKFKVTAGGIIYGLYEIMENN